MKPVQPNAQMKSDIQMNPELQINPHGSVFNMIPLGQMEGSRLNMAGGVRVTVFRCEECDYVELYYSSF